MVTANPLHLPLTVLVPPRSESLFKTARTNFVARPQSAVVRLVAARPLAADEAEFGSLGAFDVLGHSFGSAVASSQHSHFLPHFVDLFSQFVERAAEVLVVCFDHR